MKKNKHRSQNNEEIGLFTIVKRCLIFSPLFLIIALAFLLILSLIFIRIEDSTAYVGLIGKLSLYSSAFICSFLLSRKNKQDYLFSGIFLGAILTFIIFTISLFYPGRTANTVIWLLFIPLSTLIGGLLGKKRIVRNFKHRKR